MKRSFELRADGRTIGLRMPPGWSPPYPAWESEFAQGIHEIAMILVGVQHAPEDAPLARDILTAFVAMSAGEAASADLSRGHVRGGRDATLATLYFTSRAAGEAFLGRDAVEAHWRRHAAPGLPYGLFREIYNIPLERYETLHSGPDHVVGVAHARTGLVETGLHAYWGSMRDRIPGSATDSFDPAGDVEIVERSPARVLLRPNENLAVIRSGQDYAATSGTERDEYLSEVEPHLARGMDFLRDEGWTIGCLDCRYMRLLDEAGMGTDHTYGFAIFRSLGDLEAWAEHHPTHLAIFDAFLRFAPRYGPAMRSRYWHEVSVLAAADTWMEYVNCVPGTGLSPAV